MDAAASGGLARRTKSPAAYGEVVWSWRRDRGVYPKPACAGLATVTINAAHRGEHEVSRKAIARGRPGCLGCTCLIRVRSFSTHCTRCCGRSRRPAFPAPFLREKGAARIRRAQAESRRENENACSVIASEATLLRLLRKLRRALAERIAPKRFTQKGGSKSSFLSRNKKAGLLRRGACLSGAHSRDPLAPRNDGGGAAARFTSPRLR